MEQALAEVRAEDPRPDMKRLGGEEESRGHDLADRADVIGAVAGEAHRGPAAEAGDGENAERDVRGGAG